MAVSGGPVNPVDDATRLLAALPVELKAARARRKHTQVYVGQITGMSSGSVSRIERGLQPPSTAQDTLALIRYLGWEIIANTVDPA